MEAVHKLIRPLVFNYFSRNNKMRFSFFSRAMDDFWRNKNVAARQPSPCSKLPSDQRPCLDEKDLFILRGMPIHTQLIRYFLYKYHWPRDPSIMGLFMDLNSPYLSYVTDSYATTGDRFLVFEHKARFKETKMIGFAVARKKYPWMIDELKRCAHATFARPENIKLYFNAHCLEQPNFFEKYNVDYVYDIECIRVADDVENIGVEDMLLQTVVDSAEELRYSLVQVVSGWKSMSKLCERSGLKREWTMDHSEFKDVRGKPLFYPRIPHHEVGIYVKYFDPKKSLQLPCMPSL